MRIYLIRYLILIVVYFCIVLRLNSFENCQKGNFGEFSMENCHCLAINKWLKLNVRKAEKQPNGFESNETNKPQYNVLSDNCTHTFYYTPTPTSTPTSTPTKQPYRHDDDDGAEIRVTNECECWSFAFGPCSRLDDRRFPLLHVNLSNSTKLFLSAFLKAGQKSRILSQIGWSGDK